MSDSLFSPKMGTPLQKLKLADRQRHSQYVKLRFIIGLHVRQDNATTYYIRQMEQT